MPVYQLITYIILITTTVPVIIINLCRNLNSSPLYELLCRWKRLVYAVVYVDLIDCGL